MKKIDFCKFFLLIAFCLSAGILSAQTQFISADFSSNTIPSGWEEDNDISSTATWSFDEGTAKFVGGAKLNATAALITPAVDLTESNTPSLIFKFMNTPDRGNVDTLIVSYRTSSTSDWVEYFVTSEVQTTYSSVQLDLTDDMLVSELQFKFEVINAYGESVILDDIYLVNAVVCTTTPTNFKLSSLTTTSMTFFWMPNMLSEYSRLVLTTSPMTNYDNIDATTLFVDSTLVTTTYSTITINNLVSNVRYYAYVRSECGGGDNSAWLSLECVTPCELIEVGDSYVDGFEDSSTCWAFTSSTGEYATITDNVTANTGSNSLLFDVKEGGYSYAVAPFNANLKDFQLSMWLYTNQESSDALTAEINVGIIDNPSDLSDITTIETIVMPIVGEWSQATVALRDYEGEGQYIILFCGDTEKDTKIWIDDLEIKESVDCYIPQLFNLDSYNDHSATLSWIDASSTSTWNIRVSKYELGLMDLIFASTDADVRVATTNNYIVDNLSYDTKYYIYVQSECGEWNETPVTFTTPTAITLGYYDPFNYSDFPTTWTYGNMVQDDDGNWVAYDGVVSKNGSGTALQFDEDFNRSGSTGSSLFMYCSSGADNIPYIIFPALDYNVDMSKTQVRLYLRQRYNIGKPCVSICDGYDITTAVVIDSLISTKTGSYEEFIIDLSKYSGSGRNIAISGLLNSESLNTYYYYFDDFYIEELVECASISNVTVYDQTISTATISWSSPGYPAGSTWDIELYKSAKTSSSTAAFTFPNLTSTTYTMEGLEMGEKYYAYIKLNSTSCPNSDWSDATEIQMDEYIIIPYFEDFTDHTTGCGNGPTNWNTITPYGTSTYYCAKVSAFEWEAEEPGEKISPEIEINCLQIYSHSDYSHFVVMPQLEESYNVSELMMSFYGKGNNTLLSNSTWQYTSTVTIGVMTDKSDYTTFTAIETIDLVETTEYYTINLSSYTGEGRYIAFYGSGAESVFNDVCIDNIELYEISECDKVSDITVTNIQQTTIDIDWTPGAYEKSWNIKLFDKKITIDDAADNTANLISETSTTTYPFTMTVPELSHNTDYYLAIQSVIDNVCETRWVIGTFNSRCDFYYYEKEFYEDFTGLGDGDNDNIVAPDCWYLKPYSTTYSCYVTAPMESGLTSSGATITPNYYIPDADVDMLSSGRTLFMRGCSDGYTYAIMPNIEDIKYSVLQFQAYATLLEISNGTIYPTTTLEVGIMESIDETFVDPTLTYTDLPATDALFTSIETYTLVGGQWSDITVDLTEYTGNGSRIAFRTGKYTTGTFRYLSIDNISVVSAECMNIETQEVIGYSTDWVKISWNQVVETEWGIEVSTTPISPNAGDKGDVYSGTISGFDPSTDGYTITGLSSGEKYYIYLRRQQDNCNGLWSDALIATTMCDGIEVGYSEDFNNLDAYGEGETVNCIQTWGTADYAGYPAIIDGEECFAIVNDTYTDVEYNITTLGNSYVILPEYLGDSINPVEINFRAYSPNSDGGAFQVSVVTDPTLKNSIGDSYVEIYRDTIPTGEWTDYSVKFTEYTGDAFARQGKYIVISAMAGFNGEYQTSNIIYIDDISLATASCPEPMDFETVDLTDNSVTYKWSTDESATWNIILSTEDVDNVTGTSDFTSTVSGGTGSTTGTASLATGLSASTTYYLYIKADCDRENLYYTQFSFTTLDTPTDVPYFEEFDELGEVGNLPQYWYTSSSSTATVTTVSDSDVMVPDTTLYIPKNGIVVLPNLVPDVNTLQISFDAVSASASASVSIGVVPHPSETASFETLATFSVDQYSSVTEAISNFIAYDFAAYSGDSRFIALKATGAAIYVDDVLLDYNTNCDAVGGLEVTYYTTVSAEVEWSNSGTDGTQVVVATKNAYDVEYLSADDILFNENLPAGVTSYEFDTEEVTTYYVYAKAICGTEATTAVKVTFATSKTPVEIPFYDPVDYISEDDFYAMGFELLNTSKVNGFETEKFGNDTVIVLNGNSNSIYFQFPDFDLDYDLKDLMLDFDGVSYSETATRTVAVGTLDIRGDYTSFKSYESFTFPMLDSSNPTLSSWSVNFGNYSGSSRTIAIMVSEKNSVYFDDFYLYPISPCSPATNLEVSNVTDYSVNLTFEPFKGQTAWTVVAATKQLTSTELDNGTSNSIKFTKDITDYEDVEISGFSGLTTYYLYVKGDCGSDAEWSAPVSFTTPIAPERLPYTEQFTTSTVGYLPVEWYRASDDIETATITYIEETESTYSDFAVVDYDGNILYTYMNGTTDAPNYEWAITPRIVIDQETSLSFNLRTEMGENYATSDELVTADRLSEIRVLFSTDNGATWGDAVVIGDAADADYALSNYFETTGHIIIELDKYLNDTVRFAFYIDNEDAVELDVYIDDISINCVDEVTYTDEISEGFDYDDNGFYIPYTDLSVGLNTFERTEYSTESGVCDQEIYLNLTVIAPTIEYISATICEGDVYDKNGFSYGYEGVYRKIDTSTTTGADSITFLTLSVLEANPITVTEEYICDGDSYEFYGEYYSEAGVYTHTLIDVNGCDSIMELNLTVVVDGAVVPQTASICEGDYHEFYGENLTESGVYTEIITSESGCSSTIELTLEVLPKSITSTEVTICSGDSYTFEGKTYTEAGEYSETYIAANGCDSIVSLILNVYSPGATDLGVKYICEGESYVLGSQTLTVSGVYSETFTTVNHGCDSIVTVTLEVLGDYNSTAYTMCEGESYEFNGEQLTVSGVYTQIIASESGECEGTVELTLTVITQDTIPFSETIAESDLPYTYEGIEYGADTEIGEYSDTTTVTGDDGCIDVIIYTLIVIQDEVAVSNTSLLDLTIYPNPLTAGSSLYIDAEFTTAERNGMVIEVFNTLGQKVVNQAATSDPIVVDGLTQSGVYVVRITAGTGSQYLGKVIVK